MVIAFRGECLIGYAENPQPHMHRQCIMLLIYQRPIHGLSVCKNLWEIEWAPAVSCYHALEDLRVNVSDALRNPGLFAKKALGKLRRRIVSIPDQAIQERMAGGVLFEHKRLSLDRKSVV